MRIVAGNHRSRKIEPVPGQNTRPTTDKVKEAVFSKIGPYFDGEVVLDLFAGSGNLGLESISRGAKQCYFVDHHHAALKTIKANVDLLKEQQSSTILNMDYQKALSYFKTQNIKFDIVFLDPPYHEQKINEIIKYLMDNQLLNSYAMVVCECLKEDQLIDEYLDIYQKSSKNYGITKITIFEREN